MNESGIENSSSPIFPALEANETPPFTERNYILQQLNSFLDNIIHSINSHSPIEIVLVNRQHPGRNTTLSFPGQTAAQAWRFAAFTKLLEIVYGCVHDGRIVSKRDIYYQNVNIFKKQIVVDRLVDDLAATLNVKRSSLNVVAAAKGLVAGNVVIHLRNNQTIDCREKKTETLIPLRMDIREVVVSPEAEFILVLEKEAIFRNLLSNSDERLLNRSAMLTGKGYPDVSTREFLVLLRQQSHLPVYCITDFDPHGLEIASTYRNGSQSLRHEGSSLITSVLQRVGVSARHFKDLVLSQTVRGEEDGLLCLSPADRRKALEMLTSTALQDSNRSDDLQLLLFVGYKAEIEILETRRQGSLQSKVWEMLSQYQSEN